MNPYVAIEAISRRFRRRRMQAFAESFGVTPATRILDVGGTAFNWRLLPFEPELTILNIDLDRERVEGKTRYVKGDGRRLPFPDRSFDVVFSNSVIEHVGGWEDQQACAREIRRVGKSYYVQTPNRSFAVEPHLMTPGIHFLPRKTQERLLRNFSVWGLIHRPTREQCRAFLDAIRLLGLDEMRDLFPDAAMEHERLAGMTKSLIACKRAG